MNILLINHYAGSTDFGMEFRPYYMAKQWTKNGHDVTIIAGSFSHLRSRQPAIRRNFEEQIIEGIRYVWVKTPAYKGNGVIRFLSMLVFVFKLLFRCRYISEKYLPDVVIASSTYPLDNYAARKIAQRSDAKHIYEVHDLWPLTPMELGGLSKWHPFVLIMQKAENYSFKYADHIVSMLPKAKEYMLQHGMQKDKFNYVPNGIMPEEWETAENIPDEHAAVINMLKDENRKIVGYLGGHAISNALDIFIDAVSIMQNTNIAFVMVGSGTEKERLIEKAKSMNIDNLYFLPPVSKRAVPQLLSLIDILYLGWKKQDIYKYGISPNKLLDYMMAGKPVVHSVNAANDIVKDSNCGISVNAEDPAEIAEGINKLLALTENEREIMGSKGKDYVLKYHSYDILASEMIQVFLK